MADIIQSNMESANPTDTGLAVQIPALPTSVIDPATLQDNHQPFFGEFYGAYTVEQAHAREELVLFLQKHAPAYYIGSWDLEVTSPAGYDAKVSYLFSYVYAGTRTANPLPPLPPNGSHFGTLADTLIVQTPDYLGKMMMFTGLPTVALDTQMVYISPSNGVFSIGGITQPTITTITIKNSSSLAQTLLGVDYPTAFGITFTDFVAGTVLASQESITLTIEISMDGLRDVNANFYITTSRGRMSYTLILSRINVILLNMEPNSGSYKENYEYRTKIFTSMTKKEARKPLLDIPRRSVNYSVNIYSYKMYAYAKNLALFALYNATKVFQPLWLRGTKLQVSVVRGNVLICDTVGRGFVIGENVVIQNSPSRNVNLTSVLTITDTQITVADAVTADSFADIVPLFYAYTGKTSAGTFKNGQVHSHSYTVKELNYG